MYIYLYIYTYIYLYIVHVYVYILHAYVYIHTYIYICSVTKSKFNPMQKKLITWQGNCVPQSSLKLTSTENNFCKCSLWGSIDEFLIAWKSHVFSTRYSILKPFHSNFESYDVMISISVPGTVRLNISFGL